MLGRDGADPAAHRRLDSRRAVGDHLPVGGGEAMEVAAQVVPGVPTDPLVPQRDVLRDRSPPDVLDLGTHVVVLDPTGGKVVDDRPPAGGLQGIQRRAHRGHDGEPVDVLAQSLEQLHEVCPVKVDQGLVVGLPGKSLLEPVEVRGDSGVDRACPIEVGRDLRAPTGSRELPPSGALGRRIDQCGVKIRGRRAGSQQRLGRPLDPSPLPPAQGGAGRCALLRGSGREDGLLERCIEDLRPEGLQCVPDVGQGGQHATPVADGARIGQSQSVQDLAHDGVQVVQATGLESFDAVAGLDCLVRRRQVGIEPRVVATIGAPGAEAGEALDLRGRLVAGGGTQAGQVIAAQPNGGPWRHRAAAER